MGEPCCFRGCRWWGGLESWFLQGALVLTWLPLFGPPEGFSMECGSWLIGWNHSLILRGLAEELQTQGVEMR